MFAGKTAICLAKEMSLCERVALQEKFVDNLFIVIYGIFILLSILTFFNWLIVVHSLHCQLLIFWNCFNCLLLNVVITWVKVCSWIICSESWWLLLFTFYIVIFWLTKNDFQTWLICCSRLCIFYFNTINCCINNW